MVKNRLSVYVTFIFLFLNILPGNSQTKSLENKIKAIEKDIKVAEKILKETSKNKETSVNQVNLLQTQINQRENLINTYQEQIKFINKEIQSNKNEISLLEKDLALYRKEYANLIVINYRNQGKTNNILFVFSSDDFNQAIRRMRYVKELKEMLKDKIEEIDSTQIKIGLQLKKNEKNKNEKESILEKEKKERASMMKERDKLKNDIASLKKKEKEIQKEIDSKDKQTKELRKQIEKIIAEEKRKALEREAAAKKKNTVSVDYNLSNSFVENKGKLPFPVESGIITKKYGKIKHPTRPGVTIENNGIDITTTRDAKAKSVFKGEVSVVFIQGSNSAVLVRHGHYFTLYSNLDKVYVKKDDKVSIGQEIGRVHTNANDGTTILHFQIWQEDTTQSNGQTIPTNPEYWIKKM